MAFADNFLMNAQLGPANIIQLHILKAKSVPILSSYDIWAGCVTSMGSAGKFFSDYIPNENINDSRQPSFPVLS